MAKSYQIPGFGHFKDNGGSKQYQVPGFGHFKETTISVEVTLDKWDQGQGKPYPVKKEILSY